MVGGRDELLVDAHFVVDQVAGVVFHQSDGTWARLPFRVRSSTAGIRSGPFSLLCIYVRYPGRRFTNGELTVMLGDELSAGSRSTSATSSPSLSAGDQAFL